MAGGFGGGHFRSPVQVSGGYLLKFMNLNDDEDSPSAGIMFDGSFAGPLRANGGGVFDVTHPTFGDGGAKGDGVTDDTAAIQEAIDAAVAAGGGTVFFPLGTYLLNGTRQSAYRATGTLVVDTLLVIGSNIRLIGAGYGSCLKVADDYTDAGDYRVIASDSETVNNVEIGFLRIDGNGLNNLVIDSSANVRRAYMVQLLKGSNAYIHDCWFDNCPGRNTVLLGANTAATYDWSDVRIVRNRFTDMGGAVVGNGNQNDHSTVYLQADRAEVSHNFFRNTTQPDPFSSPSKAIVALEIHGRNTIVSENQVHNYAGGGNVVASVHDNENSQWLNNRFTGMTSNVVKFYTAGGYFLKHPVVRGNLIQVDNATYNGGTGIFQATDSATTSTAIEDLVIEDNDIYGTSHEQLAVTTGGILLCAVDGGSIRRNRMRDIQGAGLSVEMPSTTTLPFRRVAIEENSLIDCGIHSVASRIWAIRLENTSDNHEIADVVIRNNHIARTLQAVDVTPWAIRGIRLTGAGRFRNVRREGNTFENIPNYTLRYDDNSLTNAINCTIIPRAIANVDDSDPTFGIWQGGVEYVIHSDPAASGFFGKVATTTGGGSSDVWAGATAYKLGDWIRTSGNKVLRCVTAGTSHAATEPNPTTVGIVLGDGTVEWVYLSATVVVFKAFGEIAA